MLPQQHECDHEEAPVITSVTSLTLSSVHLMRALRTLLRRRDTTVVMGTRKIVTASPASAGNTWMMRISNPITTRICRVGSDSDRSMRRQE